MWIHMSTFTCMPKQIPKKGILLRRANSIAFTCSPEIKSNICIYHSTSWFVSHRDNTLPMIPRLPNPPGTRMPSANSNDCGVQAHTRTHTHTHIPCTFSHRFTRVLRLKENNRLAQTAYLDRTRVVLQLFCIDPVDGA